MSEVVIIDIPPNNYFFWSVKAKNLEFNLKWDMFLREKMDCEKKKDGSRFFAVLIGIGFAFDRDNEPASNNQLR